MDKADEGGVILSRYICGYHGVPMCEHYQNMVCNAETGTCIYRLSGIIKESHIESPSATEISLFSCKYLLPCGLCEFKKELCNQLTVERIVKC